MQKYLDSVKQAELLSKYLKGTLTEGEQKQLEEWLDEDSAHAAWLSDLKEDAVISQKMKSYNQYSSTESWQAVSRAIRSERRIVFSRYLRRMAVAALVAIAFGTAYLFKETEFAVSKETSVLIVSGGSKARLLLDDGSTVDLDTLKSFVANGVQVDKSGNGQIRYMNSGSEANVSSELVYNRIEVPRGGEYDMVLEDGTQVWLNSETHLKFPIAFTGKERKVFLEGEAYFAVAKNADKPFRVVVNGQTLEVLGTEFNVNAYRDEQRVYTTLVEGKVKVTTVNQEEVFLQPGEQVALEVESGLFTKEFVSLDAVMGWRKGLFALEEQTLGQIMQKLSRWYDFDVVYQNMSLKAVVFKGSIPRYGDFSDVLHLLEKTGELKFRVQDRTVIVYTE